MSGLPFELLLAMRYLRPKRTFVSVITFISVFGVALGVAVLIIVISVMSGFDKQMRDTILGLNAHLKIVQPERAMVNYPEIMAVVASNRNVRGVAPYVMGQVLMETTTNAHANQQYAAAPWVRGIDPRAETNVSVLPRSIIEGAYDLHGHGLLVGTVLAQNLGLHVGDTVELSSPRDVEKMRRAYEKHEDLGVPPMDYEVRGIFEAGYYDFNATVVVTSLQNAQDMYDLGDGVHGLMVMLNDPFQADKVRNELRSVLGPDFEIRTWLEESSLLAAVLVEKNVMLYILFFIVIVAAFGITCTLITFIVMKTREIGVLKALGASNRQVTWVFLGQSLFVSVLGIIVGLALGLLAVHFRNEFLDWMRRWTGLQLFPADIYGISQLPALIVPGDIAIICGGSLLICLIAAAAPARYASRMNPVEALRYE